MRTLFNIFKCAQLAMGLTILAVTAGCAGGYYDVGVGGPVVAPGPDVSFYGGFYGRGHDVHAFSHRGSVSRGGVSRGGHR